MRSRIIQFAIIILGISLIVNLSRDILRLLKAADQVKLAEQKVEELKTEKEKLVKKKEYYQSAEFIEEEARNRLNMARPGETIVVLPANIEELASRRQRSQTPDLPNWEKWWRLFF